MKGTSSTHHLLSTVHPLTYSWNSSGCLLTWIFEKVCCLPIIRCRWQNQWWTCERKSFIFNFGRSNWCHLIHVLGKLFDPCSTLQPAWLNSLSNTIAVLLSRSWRTTLGSWGLWAVSHFFSLFDAQSCGSFSSQHTTCYVALLQCLRLMIAVLWYIGQHVVLLVKWCGQVICTRLSCCWSSNCQLWIVCHLRHTHTCFRKHSKPSFNCFFDDRIHPFHQIG